jgi:hypothetical protein
MPAAAASNAGRSGAKRDAGARERRGRREQRESKAERTIELAQTPGRGFALGGRSTSHRLPRGKSDEIDKIDPYLKVQHKMNLF